MRTFKDSDPLPPMVVQCLDEHGRALPDYYHDAYTEWQEGTDADEDWPTILARHLGAARGDDG
ncbi:MAG: hypothetical protein GY851_09380 [bacterium]|nr:hypothetical protein [bacterium]